MREWQRLSSVQLGELIQRLYIRLEQYEIHHVASLADSPQRDVAMVLADRMRKRMDDASALLDRRLAEAIGRDAHMQVARLAQPVDGHIGQLGKSRCLKLKRQDDLYGPRRTPRPAAPALRH